MIWFVCKKCGKTHGRGESSAGTMIFCDCGQGNTVPWESTTAEPAAPPVIEAPRVPDLGPIHFDPVKGTHAPPSEPPPRPSSYPQSKTPPPIDDEERPYRRGRTEKRDPDFCFNHQRRPRVEACGDCEEGFCVDCLVKFQGALLCGPCKNFRARREELPPESSSMASASLIISLIAGPLLMCLLLMSPGNNPIRVLSYLALLPQVLAMALGIWALREAEKERKGGGQWIATTGVATAAMTCVLMLLLQVYANKIVT